MPDTTMGADFESAGRMATTRPMKVAGKAIMKPQRERSPSDVPSAAPNPAKNHQLLQSVRPQPR